MPPVRSTSSTPNALTDSLARFGSRRVVVLGDVVADEYVIGRPARISREAPVLILQHSTSYLRPGGATNAAYNFSTLGAHTTVVGLVGDDETGRQLRSLLEREGIDVSGLVVDPSRATSVKTRILAKGTQEVQQHIVRVDRVDTSEVGAAVRSAMVDAFCGVLEGADAVLISDYDCGVISDEVLAACLPIALGAGKLVVADSHGDLLRFRGVTAATPNQPEAEATLGRTIDSADDLVRAGEDLVSRMDARGLLITRGSEGIALFERGESPYLLPISASGDPAVVDPNGAGDTVAAVFTLALSSGATMREAAYLANVAGGEVVKRFGPAAITTSELDDAVCRTHLEPPDRTYNGTP